MTQRELIIERVKTMDAKTLYNLFDSSFRYLDVAEQRTLCQCCLYRKPGDEDVCAMPDDVECPSEVYTAWVNQEVNDYDA